MGIDKAGRVSRLAGPASEVRAANGDRARRDPDEGDTGAAPKEGHVVLGKV